MERRRAVELDYLCFGLSGSYDRMTSASVKRDAGELTGGR